MNITEKASYLKGLLEGLSIDATKPEGKMIEKLTALVSDLADEVAVLKERMNTLSDYVEELDEDLGEVEELLCDSDDDCDCDCDDCECDGDCDNCDCDGDCDDCDCGCDEDFYEVECPSCGETVCFDDSIDPSDVTCPACGEKFDCTCDAEDCECCEGCEE